MSKRRMGSHGMGPMNKGSIVEAV